MNNQQRTDIWHWFVDGKISAKDFNAAMLVASPHPKGKDWLRLLADLLLYLSTLMIGAGVIFFMAFNWEALSRTTKFALVEGLFLLFIVGFYLVGHYQRKAKQNLWDDKPISRRNNGFGWSIPNAMLLGASIILGALLALVGQTYQTGADPWQLFATWALFIFPFAYIAGFDLLWLLLLLLVNVSLVIYLQTFSGLFGFWVDDIQKVAVIGLANIGIHLVSSIASGCRWPGQFNCHSPSVVNVSLLGGLCTLTWLMFLVVFQPDFMPNTGFYILLYLAILLSLFIWYRYRQPALYPLTLVLTSLSAFVVALLSRGLWDSKDPVGAIFLLAMIVVGLTSACAFCLKLWQREFSEMAKLKDEARGEE